jgi:hypothetical protein
MLGCGDVDSPIAAPGKVRNVMRELPKLLLAWPDNPADLLAAAGCA